MTRLTHIYSSCFLSLFQKDFSSWKKKTPQNDLLELPSNLVLDKYNQQWWENMMDWLMR